MVVHDREYRLHKISLEKSLNSKTMINLSKRKNEIFKSYHIIPNIQFSTTKNYKTHDSIAHSHKEIQSVETISKGIQMLD